MTIKPLVRFAFAAGVLLAGTAVASAQGSPVDGIWLGTLSVGNQTIRAQVRLSKGATVCIFDSVDQKAFGIPCGNVKVAAEAVSFDVPAVQGKWVGKISADGKTLTGDWSQGPGSLPLVMTRQDQAIEGPKAQPPTYDASMPAVPLADLKAVLDKDLPSAVVTRELSPESGGGVTIGVVQHGMRRIWSYGAAKDDSVYEIGSISKTFTATILAQMVEQKKVTLDQPVRELLPPGTVAKPASGAQITLLDLSDQHSGLPRMPDNFHPADPANPYADYDAKALYQFVGQHGLSLPPSAPFGYSNLGVGLLGQALANKAGVSYGTLLQREVTGPLGMKSTAIALTPEMKARFIEGHDGEHKPAHAWDLDALAGAGGIRSDAADMLAYLEAQLNSGRYSGKGEVGTLPAAIAATHIVRAEAGPGMHIALNWFRYDETGSYWHNGATGGYSSYAIFNPEKDFAVVVLFNRSAGEGAITDELGLHLAQRLQGLPSITIR